MMEAPKYELVDVSKEGFHGDHWGIKVLEGAYEGVVFQYDTVKIEEQTDDGDSVLTFNTINVEVPEGLDMTEEMNENVFGSILTQIITEEAERVLNENGTDDTGETD